MQKKKIQPPESSPKDTKDSDDAIDFELTEPEEPEESEQPIEPVIHPEPPQPAEQVKPVVLKSRRHHRNRLIAQRPPSTRNLPNILEEHVHPHNTITTCVICKKRIDTSELVYNMEYKKLACGQHFGHVACMKTSSECRVCICLVCHTDVNLNSGITCTCGCVGHQKCVQGGIFHKAVDNCKRCDRFTHAPIIAKTGPGLWVQLFGEDISCDVIRKHRGTAETANLRTLRANGITAGSIFNSRLTLGDLHTAGFTLVDLRDVGFTGNMFVRRLFAPVILFSQFKTGPYYANNGTGEQVASHVVTGPALLTIFNMQIVDLFCANVGIVQGPTTHQFGREEGTAPFGAETLALARLNFADCKQAGLVFEHVLFLKAPFAVWDNLLAVEEDPGYLCTLPCSDASKGHRGYFLRNEIGWSDGDIKQCKLANEMAAPIVISSSSSSDDDASSDDDQPQQPVRNVVPFRPPPQIRAVPSTMGMLRAHPGIR